MSEQVKKGTKQYWEQEEARLASLAKDGGLSPYYLAMYAQSARRQLEKAQQKETQA